MTRDDEPDQTTVAATPRITRAEQRRLSRDVIADGAPREGVDIIRPVERAVIVGVGLPGRTAADVAASLDELEALLDTAGATVVDRVVQFRDAPDSATFIGRGKLQEVIEVVQQHGADAVVFDEDLTPAQQRVLEEKVRQKVLDRTIVILDIFAQHATSKEGKAQVELAQLTYLLPRLRGWGEALSRQAGGRTAGGAGIGGRGPGETQLEVDRRRLMRRIAKLKRDLTAYQKIRQTKAQERVRFAVPVIALVGYTNAGKSSLLNALTGATVLVEDRLFATLDPTVRRFTLSDGRQAVLTDTVGFVRKLPHGLVEAFASTLEESLSAQLLLHVVDASHPEAEAQIVAVHQVLEDVGAERRPQLVVLNKADQAERVRIEALARRITEATGVAPVIASAVTGEGLVALTQAITDVLPTTRVPVVVEIPYSRYDMVSQLHTRGQVHDLQHNDTSVRVDVDVDADLLDDLAPFTVPT
jgi:GTP-binding protein HflX